MVPGPVSGILGRRTRSIEWGNPIFIPTPGLGQLTESIQKAACLQLMHDRLLIPQQPSPMLLMANRDDSSD